MQGARGSRLSLRLIRLWRKQAEGSKQKAKSKAQRPETADRGPEIEDC